MSEVVTTPVGPDPDTLEPDTPGVDHDEDETVVPPEDDDA